MGKKNKKEKKGKGKEKTETKTEKKAEKRTKKELTKKGEEDIEKLILEFQEQDKRLTQVIEEQCPPPSPRCSATFVPHPDRDELLLFGGEYYTGNKMYVYNDLYSYQTKKKEWLNISVPNAPPPRSAHQAVTVSHQGGQMWVFGGEFSSHTQSQFYHYKDLWVLHLKDKRWEQHKLPGGPSARSGHRMVAVKKQLLVFGGFNDNTRVYRYFNDIYSFNLETYTWCQINPAGQGPSPRSGCIFMPFMDGTKAVIYGGYSKEKTKKDLDKGVVHTDIHVLALEKNRGDESSSEQKWKWQSVKQSSLRPSPRSGMTVAMGPNNKAYCFGGVFDEEEDEETLEGVFFNELWSLDLNAMKWFPVQLRKKKAGAGDKKRRRKKDEAAAANPSGDANDEEEDDEEDVDMAVAATEEAIENLDIAQSSTPQVEDGASAQAPQAASIVQDEVFKVVVDDTPSSSGDVAAKGANGDEMEVDQFWPSKRMNAALAVQDGKLFLYGGMIEEEEDKQVTLADFYSLDLHRLEEWDILIAEDRTLQVWEDSDDEEEGAKSRKRKAGPDMDRSEEPSSEEDSDDDDDDDEITFDDAPSRREGEPLGDYFERAKDYWVQKAREIYEEDGESVSERRLVRFAKEICEEALGK